MPTNLATRLARLEQRASAMEAAIVSAYLKLLSDDELLALIDGFGGPSEPDSKTAGESARLAAPPGWVARPDLWKQAIETTKVASRVWS